LPHHQPRGPADLSATPDCGKCHRPLFDGHPVALDEGGVRQAHRPLAAAGAGGFLGALVRPLPHDGAAVRGRGEAAGAAVRLAKVNTEEAQQLAAALNIRSIPTLALFVNGREVARQPGAMGAADIVRWTRSHLG
jgi:thioredoxin 2